MPFTRNSSRTRGAKLTVSQGQALVRVSEMQGTHAFHMLVKAIVRVREDPSEPTRTNGHHAGAPCFDSAVAETRQRWWLGLADGRGPPTFRALQW